MSNFAKVKKRKSSHKEKENSCIYRSTLVWLSCIPPSQTSSHPHRLAPSHAPPRPGGGPWSHPSEQNQFLLQRSAVRPSRGSAWRSPDVPLRRAAALPWNELHPCTCRAGEGGDDGGWRVPAGDAGLAVISHAACQSEGRSAVRNAAKWLQR